MEMEILYKDVMKTIDYLAGNRDKVLVAIDGRCGAGKTTLGEFLKARYNCSLFHMDDFFLRKEQRTPQRYEIPGGNVDHERFLEEVLLPLSRGQSVSYRAFDCSRGELGEKIAVECRSLNVIEGSYSMHPELMDYYDLKIFLDINENDRKKRITDRKNNCNIQMFFDRWIPLEEAYFNEYGIKDKADIIVNVSESAK